MSSGSSPDLTDQQVALVLLQEGGQTREQAALTLAQFPEQVGTLAGAISAKRETWKREIAERAQADFAASPAGRAKAAKAALAARQERDALVEGARALLENDGYPTDSMTPDEVLWAARIEARPAAAMTLRERDNELDHLVSVWERLPEDERRSEARRLQEDPALLSRAAARLHEPATFVPATTDAGSEGGGDQ